ncbi:MAG TPA: hypothetical protein VN040_05585 [Pseudosphingobacterium sp.]|nr:hypothetical protein [Pseudosphingobacterium sp.]
MNTKKITGTILLAAMLSGGSLAIAKVKSIKTEKALRVDQEWRYDPQTSTPSDPENYERQDGSSMNCQGDSEICVVRAPENNGQPDFSQVAGLQAALDGDLNHPNIEKGPYTGN